MNPSYNYLHPPPIPKVGTSANPINILDDQEQNKYYQRLVEQQRNSQILKQAILSRTSIDLVFSVAMTKINGETSQKQHLVKNQVINYFYKHCAINITTQYFNPRVQPQDDQHTTTLAHTIIIYGVDFLSHQQVIQIFTVPNHPSNLTIKTIKWINDSHIQLTFTSQDIALAIIKRTSSKTEGYRIKAEQEDNQFPRGWFELNSYEIYRVQRKLFARFATSKQIEIKQSKAVIRHKLFQNVQMGLQLFLLSKYSAKQEYYEMLSKIQHEENKKKVFSKKKYHPIHKHKHKRKQSISACINRFQQYMEKGRKLRKVEKPSNLYISSIQRAQTSNKIIIDLDQPFQQYFDVHSQYINPSLNWSFVERNQQSIESNQHKIQDTDMLQMMLQNHLDKQNNQMVRQPSESEHSEISSIKHKNNLINQFKHLQLDNLPVESSSQNMSLLGRNIEQYLSFRQQQSIDEENYD